MPIIDGVLGSVGLLKMANHAIEYLTYLSDIQCPVAVTTVIKYQYRPPPPSADGELKKRFLTYRAPASWQ